MPHKRQMPFQSLVLLLQGGGALGAYQAGVYQALNEAGLEPDWVAGISIGAVNAAIIAGSAPQERTNNLRRFWREITFDTFPFAPPLFENLVGATAPQHQLVNLVGAMHALTVGVPDFFRPRLPPPWLEPDGSPGAISYYETAPLRKSLCTLVDFERINRGDTRLTVGAANVTQGTLTGFDSNETVITVDHIMGSGALPPGFPPVRIDDDWYWDGGVISNAPLQWLLQDKLDRDSLIFQVDLWCAQGEFPRNMAQVLTRHKDIQYSSRTLADTERFRQQHELAHKISQLMARLPKDLAVSREAQALKTHASDHVFNIIHLIYRNRAYEGYSKDFEFSRLNMEAHWKAGYDDTVRALDHPKTLQKPHNDSGIAVFDYSEKADERREAAE